MVSQCLIKIPSTGNGHGQIRGACNLTIAHKAEEKPPSSLQHEHCYTVMNFYKEMKVKASMHKDVPAPLVLGKNEQEAQVE